LRAWISDRACWQGFSAVCGVLLVPWIGVLIEQLHGQAGKRGFDSSWVGLDVLEAVCLLTARRLLSRRRRAKSPVAAATAAILCMDAWFDMMSAAPQVPYAESLAMACFAELPLAALLAWTAWRALEWAAPRAAQAPASGAGGRTPEQPAKAPG
jgi:cytochrome c-type biogenesis protein CcmH/NrfG